MFTNTGETVDGLDDTTADEPRSVILKEGGVLADVFTLMKEGTSFHL